MTKGERSLAYALPFRRFKFFVCLQESARFSSSQVDSYGLNAASRLPDPARAHDSFTSSSSIQRSTELSGLQSATMSNVSRPYDYRLDSLSSSLSKGSTTASRPYDYRLDSLSSSLSKVSTNPSRPYDYRPDSLSSSLSKLSANDSSLNRPSISLPRASLSSPPFYTSNLSQASQFSSPQYATAKVFEASPPRAALIPAVVSSNVSSRGFASGSNLPRDFETDTDSVSNKLQHIESQAPTVTPRIPSASLRPSASASFRSPKATRVDGRLRGVVGLDNLVRKKTFVCYESYDRVILAS